MSKGERTRRSVVDNAIRLASMTGLEVGETELHTRRVADQIAEMINSSPADAASLFGKWVNTED